MLAATSIGAVWSSARRISACEGVVDRFGQIEPKVLIAADGYHYAGKRFDIRGKLAEVLESGCRRVERTVIVALHRRAPAIGGLADAVPWPDFLATPGVPEIAFERLPFDHPLYICTRPAPPGSAQVHRARRRRHPAPAPEGAGAALRHRPGDRLFYFTTCGWMMWNWLVSAWPLGTLLVLFDGSPFHPGPEVLWTGGRRGGITVFGTSAKYLVRAARRPGSEPAHHDLSGAAHAALHRLAAGAGVLRLRLPASSGPAAGVHLRRHRHRLLLRPGQPLAAGVPRRAAVPRARLAVEVFDDDGRPVVGERGELVCTRPFPCMPIGFWNDPDGAATGGLFRALPRPSGPTATSPS
jgi:acetoacetyl-CoA synthetase